MTEGSDYLQFLQKQRQTRSFTSEPVSDDDIAALLETMRWTGSASNKQPWQFLVVRDKKTIGKLSRATMYTLWLLKTPLVFVVLTQGADRFAHAYDLGRVDERILLAARALGLGAGIVTFGTEAAQKSVHQALEVPDDWSIYSAVGVGHPSETARPAKLGGRKPLDDLVFWETFGQRESS